MRYNEYRGAQIFGSAATGYSFNRRPRPSKMFYHQTMPTKWAFGHMGMSYQEQKRGRCASLGPFSHFHFLFVFLILAALYES